MLIKFEPQYKISPKIAQDLMRIQAVKEKVLHLPVTPAVLHSLRQTARLYTTHYSTMIEGNKLGPQEIAAVLNADTHFPGRDRDEYEVKGYYAALTQVEKWAEQSITITEKHVQKLHALVMSHGHKKIIPTEYRDGQNVIRDGVTRAIVYLPPQAEDVPGLMAAMISWLDEQHELPCPVIAAIIHYQFATIHPYYDGNGRTARLLTTLILHCGGYDLKGLYSLEEYYAQNLAGYYQAITVGPSHNYYMGRAESDITQWIEYFIAGMATSFENVAKRMKYEQGIPDQSRSLQDLDPRKRKVIELFAYQTILTSADIGKLFSCQPRTATKICQDFVLDGFLEIVNPSNKARSYKLAAKYAQIFFPSIK
jgi:Fic family protein